eukprot:gene4042-7331_t
MKPTTKILFPQTRNIFTTKFLYKHNYLGALDNPFASDKPFKKWNKTSKLKDIIEDNYENKSLINETLKTLDEKNISTLENWSKLSQKEKKILQPGLVTTLDEINGFVNGFNLNKDQKEMKRILDQAENLKFKL